MHGRRWCSGDYEWHSLLWMENPINCGFAADPFFNFHYISVSNFCDNHKVFWALCFLKLLKRFDFWKKCSLIPAEWAPVEHVQILIREFWQPKYGTIITNSSGNGGFAVDASLFCSLHLSLLFSPSNHLFMIWPVLRSGSSTCSRCHDGGLRNN